MLAHLKPVISLSGGIPYCIAIKMDFLQEEKQGTGTLNAGTLHPCRFMHLLKQRSPIELSWTAESS